MRAPLRSPPIPLHAAVRPLLVALVCGLAPVAAGLPAQEFPTDDPTIREIWREGMERSRIRELAQPLLDSIGPRLTGSPGQEAAADWLVRTYEGWGVEARNEVYGTWEGWRRGITHLDLVEPRVRSLEATMLAWSAGTGDEAVQGEVLALPPLGEGETLDPFLDRVRGRVVLLSFPEPTCRPEGSWRRWGTRASVEAMRARRDSARERWERTIARAGGHWRKVAKRLEKAGAAAILTSRWSQGWGVQKIFSSPTRTIPGLDVSCEDYGLLHRLAARGQRPVVRLRADAEHLGQVPVANTIAEIPGRERPGEYVVLSAHFDSWDGASGATDNGTGTVTVAEAMRILAAVHPEPKRTILAGHWNGEEQGLNGSGAFARDHPEVVEGLQALFNQDNGTGRVVRISMQGFRGVAPFFARWLEAIPPTLTGSVELRIPGMPSGGGSDHASFVCAGAPAFSLSSLSWDYGTYTWHTDRDTFDKLVWEDLRGNATLMAMLAYLASEEDERVPRRKRVMPDGDGDGDGWPACRDVQRSGGR